MANIGNTPFIASETVFAENPVTQLSANDFALDSKTPIGLKYSDCIIILFYNDSIESRALADIWFRAASLSSANFGACNLGREKQVARAFMNLNSQDSPLEAFALRGLPTIIVYRQGYPRAFYNGDRNVAAIVDWSMVLACRRDYIEPVQLAASVAIAPQQNIEMPGWTEYTPRRTNSTQFSGTTALRGYNTQEPLVAAGSPGAQQEAASAQQRANQLSQAATTPSVRATNIPGQAGQQLSGQGGQPGQQLPGQGGQPGQQLPGQGGQGGQAGQFPGQGGQGGQAGQFPGQGGQPGQQFPGQGGQAGQFPGQGGQPGQGNQAGPVRATSVPEQETSPEPRGARVVSVPSQEDTSNIATPETQ